MAEVIFGFSDFFCTVFSFGMLWVVFSESTKCREELSAFSICFLDLFRLAFQ